METIIIGIGGGIGAIIRYIITNTIKRKKNTLFPVHTFVINILGSFLFGLSIENIDSKYYKDFFQIGFFGGFTTFSTYMLEFWTTRRYSKKTSYLYVFLSLIFGVISFIIGFYISHMKK